MAVTRPVLVALRALGLGDLLTAVPALRALRRAHPRHLITLAAPSSLRPLLPLIGAVDDLLHTTGTGPVPVERADVAVNLHGMGPQSTTALRRVHPGLLLSHAHPALPEVEGPQWRADLHEVRRWCAMLDWYGIATDPGDLALDLRVERRDATAIVHPGAASPARRWPPRRYAELAAELNADGLRVLITGSVAERVLARQVADLAGLPGDRVLAGRTGLGELAVLVARARLVVSGDTGIAHLAVAMDTPSVMICGPISPALWGPPPGRDRHVALWAGRTGDPHAARPDQGLLDIGVRQVAAAAQDVLATVGHARRTDEVRT
ncbi:glycosyltransferase family 9 protein [Spongiactinospora sp. TRM90649]|uniref:glycosyltransferase family 9 protein n=1 Tax=Spongiactinospora sp. TRM90649 TaxID=3031114 RepID=UPI0023FA2B02|nr:glycosyltransferase family 9 protein [Spongiactinospora sp. TRM90649]MDF5752900.1 glycosyltransferase family 9 protein [Spongiactinospora sp. TRM90649]